MGYHLFEREQVLELPHAEVFEFVSRAENLARITPASMGFEFEGSPPGQLSVGAEIRYRLKVKGVPVRWTTRITEWDPPHRFADLQARGPYAYWLHTHSFSTIDEQRTLMRDRVIYRVPFGLVGELARRVFVAAELQRIFDYRERAFVAALQGQELPPAAPASRMPLVGAAGAAAVGAAALMAVRRWRRAR